MLFLLKISARRLVNNFAIPLINLQAQFFRESAKNLTVSKKLIKQGKEIKHQKTLIPSSTKFLAALV